MIKLTSNKALLIFLITAFLAVQWAVTHIHLEEHHSHDGNHHQHNIQAHAHNGSSHHTDTIGSIHETGDYKVVELDNDCTSFGWKKLGDQLVAFNSIPNELLFSPKPSVIQLSKQDSNKQCYITYSTIKPRAPPQFS